MFLKSLKGVVLVLICSALFSCQEEVDEKLVVTTTNIICNSLKEVVGEDIKMICLMNSETDPHSYEPSPLDYQRLDKAFVIVSNGLHLEGKLHEVILQTSKINQTQLILMSDALSNSEIIFEEGKIADPHIWMDVKQWEKCIRFSVLELIKSFPEFEEKWMKKLDAFSRKLNELDSSVQTKINSIPKSSRVLVSAHDAFSYLSKRYEIEIRPLQGRNTMAEPSIKDVIELSNYIVDRKIKSIFVESTVNKKFIESIKENCQKKGHQVGIGGELFSDALGVEGSPESTYIGMIEHNINTIVNTLQ